MTLQKYLFASIDAIDHALIVIDTQGLIKVYNQKAASIFGVDPRIGPGHEEGCINEGDIVIIADNSLGKDDGNLAPEDLKTIGFDSSKILPGDAVVGIGVKSTHTENAVFKSTPTKSGPLKVSQDIKGVHLESSIDFNQKRLSIKVNHEDFDFYYSIAAGHAVILDGETLKIKFYQTKGYTARKEDIKSILKGKQFTKKGPDAQMPELINKHISLLHPDSEIIEKLIQVAQGNAQEVIQKESIINGIPVRCSIVAVRDSGGIMGALLKVEDVRELKELIKQRDKAIASIHQLERQLEKTKVQKKAFAPIIGVSGAIQDVINLAYRASESDSNVLLLGESGTGKNLFARAIHEASSRRDGPFVCINCSSIPESLFESELFGYEKGAFTGALVSGKMGLLEKAHGGTVFLDEIAELPLTMQAKFLHFLQTRSFTRVGGLDPININARIICATNKNLEDLVTSNQFREDLYYRINVLPIKLPPLRERPEDLPYLVSYMLPKLCKKIGKNPKKISEDALKLLKLYPWRGNVRELENVLERAINISDSNTITVNDLPPIIKNMGTHKNIVQVTGIGPLKEAVEQTERQLIAKVLKHTEGSRKKAIETLKVGKTNFYIKLKKYKLK